VNLLAATDVWDFVTSPPLPAGRRTPRARALAVAALATVVALLAAACASSSASKAPAAAPLPTSVSASGGVCAGDTVEARYQTAYDGGQPLCRGFAGDADHAGEGLAGAQTTSSVTTVVQWMLSHARAIYSFQPPAAWLATTPHPRDVNGFFHRQANPAAGDTALRAYKDFLTPAPGQPRNEQDYALVSVIVSPGAQPYPARGMVEGGVWFVGCLVYHADGHEYMETCPSWVWTVPVTPAVNKRL